MVIELACPWCGAEVGVAPSDVEVEIACDACAMRFCLTFAPDEEPRQAAA